MLNKLGHGIRWLGEKTSMTASWLGHKVGGTLNSISPVVSYLNLVIGAGIASAVLFQTVVGALGHARKALFTREEFNRREIRRTIDGIRSDAGAVRSAYSAVREAAENRLERGR